jgi:hypothetical protein
VKGYSLVCIITYCNILMYIIVFSFDIILSVKAIGKTYNTLDVLSHGLCGLDHLPQQLTLVRQWGPIFENFRTQVLNSLSETSAVQHCLFAFQRHDKVDQHTLDLE